MKVLPFVISVIILFPNFAWCNAGLQAPEPAKAPVETADRPYVWEFGVVKEGQVLEHEFNFTNTYGKDLLIKGTTTSCGCTVSEIKKNILKPGESTILSVRFDTKGYSGKVEQFVYVTTDNINEPVIKFTVKADISK